MRILLLGEASWVHFNLRKGLRELGNDVTLVSNGNNFRNIPRDIDIARNPKWGKLGGLAVLWTLLRNIRKLCGNDIVQIHNYQFITLGMGFNKFMIRFLKRHNRCLVKCCLGDDPQTINMQFEGVPHYSDTFWHGKPQNVELNKERIEEQNKEECLDCWKVATESSEALLPCLYEYYLAYDTPSFRSKLHYMPLPIQIPDDVEPKGRGEVIKVLVGVQRKREYMKGALKIAEFVEEASRRNPGKIEICYAENVPYAEYCEMLSATDVQVDQFYSYTPSMNSLAAMARGTVVIGGGEDEAYEFIGEKELRPIINVSPENSFEENVEIIEKALTVPGSVERLSRESILYARKHHDYRVVACQYESLYKKLLSAHDAVK